MGVRLKLRIHQYPNQYPYSITNRCANITDCFSYCITNRCANITDCFSYCCAYRCPNPHAN
jgi:hypothetical protein